MSRYVIKERFWSFGDTFDIYSPEEVPVFRVKGRAFSWGDKLSFQDLEGRELAFISQRLMSLMPTYEIELDGKPFAEVRKKFSWFSKTFELDVPGPNDYEIEGSFWLHDYTFRRRGRTVAQVSKAVWAWTDSYGIEVAEGENDVAILCAAIVIDQVLHDEKS